MRISFIYIVCCFFCFAVDDSRCEETAELAVCRDAANFLETILFFPMSACPETPETNQLDGSEQDNVWSSSMEEYTRMAWYLITSAQSLGAKMAHTDMEFTQFSAQLSSYLDLGHWDILTDMEQTLTSLLLKLRHVARTATGNVLASLSFVTAVSEPLTILFITFCDVSMTFKACVSTIWIGGLTTTIVPPFTAIRYVVATLLGISLPTSLYMLVREIPPSRNKIQTNDEKRTCIPEQMPNKDIPSTNIWSNYLQQFLLKLPGVSLLSKLISSANTFSVNAQRKKVALLKTMHYGMCEIYDGYICNCDGKRSPVRARKHSPSWHREPMTRFTLNPAHYPMCESYDDLSCNCGGLLRISPVSKVNNGTPKQQYRAYMTYNDDKKPPNGAAYEEPNEAQNKVPNEEVKEAPGKVSEPDLVPTPTCEPVVPLTPINEEEPVTEQLEQPEINENEINSMSMFTDVSMLDEVEEELGQPKFNSSFKENSPFVSTMSESSAYHDRGCGDGPMLVITRRSPIKECGVGIKNYDEEGSYSDDDEDIVTSDDDDDDSLLDVSDINKSMSFNAGDGVYEFAVMYTLQTIYRTTKRLFERKPTKSRDQSRSRSNDTSRETYFVVSKPKPRSKQRKQSTIRNNSSIKTPSMKVSENVSLDASLTDHDRASDLSSYYNNISREAVEAGFGSWSLSTSRDDSSFFSRQERYIPPVSETRQCSYKEDIVSNYVGAESRVADTVYGGGERANMTDVIVNTDGFVICKMDDVDNKKVGGKQRNTNNNTFTDNAVPVGIHKTGINKCESIKYSVDGGKSETHIQDINSWELVVDDDGSRPNEDLLNIDVGLNDENAKGSQMESVGTGVVEDERISLVHGDNVDYPGPNKDHHQNETDTNEFESADGDSGEDRISGNIDRNMSDHRPNPTDECHPIQSSVPERFRAEYKSADNPTDQNTHSDNPVASTADIEYVSQTLVDTSLKDARCVETNFQSTKQVEHVEDIRGGDFVINLIQNENLKQMLL